MKVLFFILLFLFSLSSAARSNRYEDGTYYNDDYISDEDTVKNVKSIEPSDTYAPDIAPPNDRVAPFHPPQRTPSHPIRKKRKPAGGFQEVRAGGPMGSFRSIRGEKLDSKNGLGTK